MDRSHRADWTPALAGVAEGRRTVRPLPADEPRLVFPPEWTRPYADSSLVG